MSPKSLPHEVSAELFRAIAEYTYDWETWVDAADHTRWINGAVERITGFSVAECLAQADYPLGLACEADRPILARVLADARGGGSGNDVEFRVRTRAGELRWVAISWQSVRSAEHGSLGYRTSVRDIDERKRMESELHRLRRRAEALAHARSELLANVSHELRSPAHCIAGFADLLLQEPLEARQRHYVEVIVEQCRSMQRQVEDLLSLTALEAGGVELAREAVDLVQLAEGLIEAARPRAQAAGLALRSQIALPERLFEGDALRLSQVLRNLIDNALKFTERGSIELLLSKAEDPEQAVFELVDTGEGMEQSEVEQLLLPFRQGDASSKKREAGVGLGLAIVQRLVAAMGGTLTIRTQRGVGTRVRVALPWTRPSKSANEPQVAVAPLGSGHALVIDDQPSARELLARLLESCGFSAAEAGSAENAVELVSQQRFDVIFIDYQMPDSDGAEAALLLRRALGRAGAERHVPIYIVTANVFAHEQLRDARAYVDGVLPKPLSRAALRAVLGQLSTAAPVVASDGALHEQVVQDLESTRHKSGKSLLQHLLAQVENDLARDYASAQRALASGDGDALRRAAHALCGQVAIVGAARARELAMQIELGAETGPLASVELRKALEEFWHAWSEARALLAERAAIPPP